LYLGLDDEEVTVPRGHPVELRRKGLGPIKTGGPVAEISAQFDITVQTVSNWRTQDRVDRVVRAEMSTSESAELSVARKRIREQESDLEITR
jgi:transposase-like protein